MINFTGQSQIRYAEYGIVQKIIEEIELLLKVEVESVLFCCIPGRKNVPQRGYVAVTYLDLCKRTSTGCAKCPNIERT